MAKLGRMVVDSANVGECSEQQELEKDQEKGLSFLLKQSIYKEIYFRFQKGGCSSNPCLNGATCEEDVERGEFKCACLDGFLGDDCGQKGNLFSRVFL